MMISLQSYVRQGRHTLRKFLCDPRVHTALRLCGYVLGGFTLSAAGLGNYAQPLALGFLCAFSSWSAVLAAIGGMLGYVVFWGSGGYQGILWLSAGLFASLFFGDRQAQGQTPLLMPALAGFIVATTGVIAQFWLKDNTPIPYYLLRVIMAGGSAWVFSQVVYSRHPILEWVAGGLGVLALAQILPFAWLGLGYVAAGLLATAAAFPAAALAGAALDFAAVTDIPMTGVLCGSYLMRFLPRQNRWITALAPCCACFIMMSFSGKMDFTPLPGLLLGGIIGTCLPKPSKLPYRRGETGVAQVRLELAAGVLAQTEQLLLEKEESPIDEDGLVFRAAERACAGCPCRKGCKDSKRIAALTAPLLHKPLLSSEELPIICRKSGRFLAELHRSQERLRSIQADRERQREYRAAVVQQFQFLSRYLQELADHLPHRADKVKAVFSPYARIFGNRPRQTNGDRCAMFYGTQGKYYVVLCDGMGTGMGAVQEGNTAVDLLRRLLVAGYPAEYALRSLNSICALRDRAGAVAVDLAELELDTGRATLYKWGAPPSYLVTQLGADQIGIPCPPPGLSVTDCREVVEKLSLRRGETLVLVSDGLGQEECLRCCRSMAGTPPGELAAALLAGSQIGAEDDATVVLIRLNKEEKIL